MSAPLPAPLPALAPPVPPPLPAPPSPKKSFPVRQVTAVKQHRNGWLEEAEDTVVPYHNLVLCDEALKQHRARKARHPSLVKTVDMAVVVAAGFETKCDKIARRFKTLLSRVREIVHVNVRYCSKNKVLKVSYQGILTQKQCRPKLQSAINDNCTLKFIAHGDGDRHFKICAHEGMMTKPSVKIDFCAPYDAKKTYPLTLINGTAHRIGWAIKTTNMKRFGVDPACGVLDPLEGTVVTVVCYAFAYGQEDTNNDRITIEWTNTPDGAAKQFCCEWLENGKIFSRHLPVEYSV